MQCSSLCRGPLGLAVAAGLAFAGPQAAAQVQRFELTALGPLTVQVGQTVEFMLTEDIDTYHYNRSLPGDAEPGPVFIGDQSWFHGLEEHSNQWLGSGRLQMALSDGRSASLASVAEDTVWRQAWQFQQPGQYTVSASGSFDFVYQYSYWSNTSSRSCFFWICGGWDSHPSNRYSSSSWTSVAAAAPLTVTVVPEPATALLWAAGLGALLAGGRRRRTAGAGG